MEVLHSKKFFHTIHVFIVAIIILAITCFIYVNKNFETNAQTNDTYTHGQYFGRNASGEEISNYTEMLVALKNNRNIILTQDIIVSNVDSYQDIYSLDTSNGYTGIVYGQGYKLIVNGIDNTDKGYTEANNNNSISNWGAVVGTLGNGGAIYDLNVVLQSNRVAFGSTDNTVVHVGGIVGQMLSGSTISNCSMTINSGTELFAFTSSSSVEANAFIACGGIAGFVNSGATITNCTVINNGEITAGFANINSSEGTATESLDRGYAGNIAGLIQNNNTITLNNLITKGTGRIYGRVAANIGTNFYSTAYTIENVYSSFEGNYEYGTILRTYGVS